MMYIHAVNTTVMKIFFAFLLPFFALAQTPITQEQRQQANQYFQASDWVKSVKAYQTIASAEPQNWNARLRWGVSLLNSGKHKESLTVLEEALKLTGNAQTYYYLGSAYALDGNKDKAFDLLDKALLNGFAFLSTFEGDPGYNAIRSDARYAPLADRLVQGIYPCRYSQEARQFDFWIGEWDVKNNQGQPAGKSKIEMMLGDCVIFENWTSAAPQVYSGKSFNLYNSATKKWMQTWVDNKGGVMEFIGGEYKGKQNDFSHSAQCSKTSNASHLLQHEPRPRAPAF
jgi:tetratricopeptide (TPR) repeat protein